MSQYYTPPPIIPMGYGQPQGYPQQPQYQQPQDTNPSCRQLLSQPVQFGQHYPAPTPAVQGLPPQIQQALPLVAIEVGNFLSQSAAQNPVYTYYYNIVSQNQFRNGFWEKLISFSGFYVWLALQQRLYASDQEAIRNSAQFSAQMMASITAMENPQLQAFVDPALWGKCAEIAQRMSSVQQQFQSLGQPQVQQVQQPYQQVAYGGQPVYNPQPVQPVQSQSWVTNVQVPQAPVTVANDPMGMGGSVYRVRGAAAVGPVTQPPKHMAIPGEPAQLVKTVLTNPAVEQRQAVRGILMAPNQGVVEVLDNQPVTGQWAPFYGQYYPPAFDSNYQKLTMVSRAVAGLVGNRNIYIVENKGEPEMDRAEHVIGTARAMYREVKPTEVPRLHAVGNDLEYAAKALLATQNKEDAATTAKYKEMGLVAIDVELNPEDSVLSLVNAARVLRYATQKDVQAAFSVSGSVACKFITRESYHGLFEVLGSVTTFGDLAMVLKTKLEQERTPEVASLVGRLDRYLTREVLHVIKRRLGLTNFSFDSFIDDIGDVFGALKADWGDLYAQALTKYQTTFIQALFGDETMSYMDAEVDQTMDCVASEPPVSVTLLDVDSLEFGVKINDGSAYEVFSTNFPGLYEFIEAAATSQPMALHHYVVTDDDVVYEVHQSLVGERVFLISNGPVIA